MSSHSKTVDTWNDSLAARQDGMTYGIVLAALEHARHSANSARSAVNRLAEYVPKVGPVYSGLVGKRDLPELAADFRAFADALDAVATPALPADSDFRSSEAA